MTVEQLQALGLDPKWLKPLNDVFTKYDINTPQRQAAFIGQCAHESGNFKTVIENLNYSANALFSLWNKRFPNMEIANEYARQPQRIANKVYSDRMGNGDEASGDGFKYRGRGLIQCTGKSLYKECGDVIGVDLIDNPDLLCEPEYAALSAGWFWATRGLNSYADKMDIEGMTRKINGGLNGLDDRKAHIEKALQVLS